MRECSHKDFIDDYLLNKLDEEGRTKFEEHYFNCHQCFKTMEERAELVAVVKSKGGQIFEEERPRERTEVFSFNRVFSFLSPRQWAYAGAAAALLLVVMLSVLPILRKSSLPFILDDSGVVRGEQVMLVSPEKDAVAAPSQFVWKKFGEEGEYKVYLFSGEEILWQASTKDVSVTLPDEIARLMQPGKTYTWQVKAFLSAGTLAAASVKVQFTIPSK